MTSPIPSEPRTPPRVYHAAAPPSAALRLTAAAIVSIYALQLIAVKLVSQQIAFVIAYGATTLGIVAIARAHKFRLGATPTPLRFWIAATIVGVTAWYVDFALVTWISPPGDAAHLKTFVEELSMGSAVVAIAIVPAVTEESIFRGVLARSLARRSTAGAIVASAAVFSLYHVNPIQVVATLPLGLALAVIAVRSDSILPGMLTHFLNNALVLAISNDELPGLVGVIERHPASALGVALTGMAIGVVLPNCKADHRPHLNW